MRERSKEILFAHFLAFGQIGRQQDANGEPAIPTTRAEDLASTTADLTKAIKAAIGDAALLIVVRGDGDGPDRNDKQARHVFDLLCRAHEAVLAEAAASKSPPVKTLR